MWYRLAAEAAVELEQREVFFHMAAEAAEVDWLGKTI
jgi:hypothetical protein